MKIRTLALLASAAFLAPNANAAFHLWALSELYTNGDGSVQFLEFTTTFGNQQFVNGQQVRLQMIAPSSVLNTFTIPANLPSDSANKKFLIGTSNLQSLYGVTPDFVLPANFLTVAGGFSNKTISFFGTNSGLSLTNLPLNGTQSLNYPTGAVNSTVTATNFSGVNSSPIPEPMTAGLVGLGVLALLRRRRS